MPSASAFLKNTAKPLVATLKKPQSICGHSDHEQKKAFHNTAKRYLKHITVLMGIPSGSFEIRSNMGGPAVSGEVTLHTDYVYFQIGNFLPNQLYRTCKGQKDYCGGPNQYFKPDDLLDPDYIANRLKALYAQA